MTARSSPHGLALALFGALLLTPDALFMRLSGMDGLQMLGWRGVCMAGIFLAAWALTSRDRRGDLARLASGAAGLVVLCQVVNATLFPLGIAAAPVAPVLLGVATVPVWAALLSGLIYGEPTRPATWAAMAAVLAGLAIAVTGKGETAFDAAALTGVLCGLGVALALAVNFVTLRFHPEMPLLLAIGLGALVAGSLGWTLSGPARMAEGTLWAILLTALVILPLSFYTLSQASRLTSAANVSLLMLLETVLAPLWVWLGLGEAPTLRMAVGGAITLTALGAYLLHLRAHLPAPLASDAALPRTGSDSASPGPP